MRVLIISLLLCFSLSIGTSVTAAEGQGGSGGAVHIGCKYDTVQGCYCSLIENVIGYCEQDAIFGDIYKIRYRCYCGGRGYVDGWYCAY